MADFYLNYLCSNSEKKVFFYFFYLFNLFCLDWPHSLRNKRHESVVQIIPIRPAQLLAAADGCGGWQAGCRATLGFVLVPQFIQLMIVVLIRPNSITGTLSRSPTWTQTCVCVSCACCRPVESWSKASCEPVCNQVCDVDSVMEFGLKWVSETFINGRHHLIHSQAPTISRLVV